MKKDYYQLLGLDKSADISEIKSAYKNLALKYHPDRNSNASENIFKDITEAYSILSDKDNRYKYDLMPTNDFSEMMLDINPEQIFNNLFGGKNSTMIFMNLSANSFKTKPLYHDVTCNLNDLYLMKEKHISYRKYIVYNAKLTPILIDKTITIPKECENNHQITFPEEGNHSLEGEKGDLIINIIIEKHPLFKRNDNDLSIDIDLLISEALTGYQYVLNFINGKNYILQLDEIINNNTISKLSNFGLPKKDGTYGDLYISYNIENPETLSNNRKDLLKKILPCRKPLNNALLKLPLLSPELVPINLNDNISETDSEPDNPLEDLLNNPLQSLFNMTNLFG